MKLTVNRPAFADIGIPDAYLKYLMALTGSGILQRKFVRFGGCLEIVCCQHCGLLEGQAIPVVPMCLDLP